MRVICKVRPRAWLAVACVLGFAAPIDAEGQEPVFDDEERRAIEGVIEDYLLEHPEIVLRALETLQQRQESQAAEQVQAAIQANRAALISDPNSPIAGNADGDVTVVEFFDYRCPYCKRVVGDVEKLLETDDGVRLVYKEWPILGPESVFAARAALAAREQGQYLPFHQTIMGQREITEVSVMAAAEELGLDVERLRADMNAPEVEAHLQVTMQLSQALGITGTPAFVIGDELVPGAVGLDQLRQLVAKARDGG